MSCVLRLSHIAPMDLSNLFSGKVSRIESRLIHVHENCKYSHSIRLVIFCRQSKPARYSTASW